MRFHTCSFTRGIRIESEIAQPLELIALFHLRFQGCLKFRCDDFQRVRIDKWFKVSLSIRFGNREEPIVQAHFRVDRLLRADPMNRPLYLATRRGTAVLLLRSAVQRSSVTLPEASFTTSSHLMIKADFNRTSPPGRSRKNFGGGVSKNHPVNKKLSGERKLPSSGRWIFGIVGRIEFFGLILRIIRNHDFDRSQNRQTSAPVYLNLRESHVPTPQHR